MNRVISADIGYYNHYDAVPCTYLRFRGVVVVVVVSPLRKGGLEFSQRLPLCVSSEATNQGISI